MDNRKLCNGCKEYLDISEFRKCVDKRSGKERLRYICFSCERARVNANTKHKYKTDPKFRNKHLDYIRNTRFKLKQELVDYLGGKCVKCGFIGHVAVFDFHHVNPQEKELQITSNLNNKNFHKALQEIHKCVLLCANCHRLSHVGVDTKPTKEIINV